LVNPKQSTGRPPGSMPWAVLFLANPSRGVRTDFEIGGMIPLRMVMIDPEKERQRLAEVYARQSDEELEQVAAQVADLTEMARETLRTELTKRGLYVGQLEGSWDSSATEFRDLVVIRSYWDLLEAQLAKGCLDAAGIEAFLFDDNMVRLDWFNANALGGVKLRVDAANAEAANRILEENASAAEALPGEDDSAG
jgi:Putative prokaryotic signal transducing protein